MVEYINTISGITSDNLIGFFQIHPRQKNI